MTFNFCFLMEKKKAVKWALKAHLGPPHEPQLEDVHVAAALQRLVPRVVGQVVVFVLLEEVAGVHLVAVLHQALQGEGGWRSSQQLHG